MDLIEDHQTNASGNDETCPPTNHSFLGFRFGRGPNRPVGSFIFDFEEIKVTYSDQYTEYIEKGNKEFS